jgi:hypothetical protein
MKFIRAQKSSQATKFLVFRIGQRERQLLRSLLELYPLLDANSHQLSKTASPSTHSQQQLLDDAMAELQREHKLKLREFVRSRFRKPTSDDHRLRLEPEQIEWLLQVLNDLRVGSWVRLGRPDAQARGTLEPSNENSHHVAVMELSGYFQMALLEAFKSA